MRDILIVETTTHTDEGISPASEVVRVDEQRGKSASYCSRTGTSVNSNGGAPSGHRRYPGNAQCQ